MDPITQFKLWDFLDNANRRMRPRTTWHPFGWLLFIGLCVLVWFVRKGMREAEEQESPAAVPGLRECSWQDDAPPRRA